MVGLWLDGRGKGGGSEAGRGISAEKAAVVKGSGLREGERVVRRKGSCGCGRERSL